VVKYADIAAVNWSSLRYMATSPRMYRWRLTHPEPRKESFVLGGAIHCAVLEPDLFSSRYGIYAPVRNGKDWIAWQKANPGVESLKPDQFERVFSAAIAVRQDRVAAPLITRGRFEHIVTWVDEVTGIPCKGRLDYLREFVVDLKSTRDPAPSQFERAAANYGYAAQTAFYHDGATRAQLIDGRERPYIIAARSGGDFDVAAFQLTEQALEQGRAMYRSLLRRLAECTAANYFPGVAPELQQLSLPPWHPAAQIATDDAEEF
jgi:hypothetical protein